MPTRRPQKPQPHSVPDHNNSPAVTAFIDAMTHALKPTLEAVRDAILTTDGAITEGIKWNSPSFYCHGWFATINSRRRNGIQLVLHHGSKVRKGANLGATIKDPGHLLTWLSKDRAIAGFVSGEDFRKKRKAFKSIITQWTAYQAQLAKQP